ncbi:MAG TPA: membrane-bound PQQ-dependent dehydrogenase, glucose/quinate/shikimate family [Alphaproteobacteria bacterium]
MWSMLRSRPVMSGVVVILLGIFFAGAGAHLIWLGGSWYYAVAGLGLIASGVALCMGRIAGLWIYAAVWIFTLVWALWESGFNVWYLMPRLLAPTVLGIYLLMPWVTLGLTPPFTIWSLLSRRRVAAAIVLLLGGTFSLGYILWPAPSSSADQPQTNLPDADAPASMRADVGSWPYYGNGPGADRFAPQAQITPDNVAQLQLAWTNRSGDSADEAEIRHEREFHSESTPIKIGNTLYSCFPHSVVQAIDATTGETKWRFDPQATREGNPYLVCRGVAYYEVQDETCPHRIYAPIFDARVVALNAETGKPCTGFAKNGYIDLTENMGDSPAGFTISTSPPMVVNDRVIIGSRIRDNRAVDEPSGVVRAYDPADGHLIWAWDMGRSDDAIPPLPPDEVYTRGTPNAWGTITADPQLGLVYLPMGNATPDYFIGKRRPFDDKYGSAIVALDIATGQQRWHFQTVHHDQWDFDLPVGPSLVDLPSPDGNGTVPALVQTTKQGQIFLLDRRDGHPLAEVEERPVPSRGVAPGQPVAPTQPFSVGMPSFTPATIQERDLWGATPIDQLLCRIEFKRLRYDGIFTPQGTDGIIGHPAFDGVVDWGGATIDPERKIMVMNTMIMPFKIRLIARDSEEGREVSGGRQVGEAPPPNTALNYYPQTGTPYVAAVGPWLGEFQVPCVAPPWGQLSAVDLKQRKILWQVTLGTSRDAGPFRIRLPVGLNTGAPNIGGSIATKGGLVFIGATTDQYLRAFDLANGKELWKARLPAGGQATPMSYMGEDGRQYVVITAGGHGALGTRYGDYTMAFALPKQ